MTQPGFAVMLHSPSVGSSNDPAKYYGKKITSVEMSEERLVISFEDTTKISILDDGQDCCESRYMTTDDDPQSLVGGSLIRVEGKDGPEEEGDYDVHETCFVEVQTNKGFITLTNHNIHNGYYGGFDLTIIEG